MELHREQERTIERSLGDDHLAELPLTFEKEEPARNHPNATSRAGSRVLANHGSPIA